MTLLELASRAGLWLQTVEHLQSRGILPPAGEDGRYTEQHLARLQFVHRMQAEHGCSLRDIEEVFAETTDLEIARHRLVAQVEPDPEHAGPGPSSRAGLRRRVAGQDALVEALIEAEVLPADGPYGGHHIWIVETAAELAAEGVELNAVLQLASLARRVGEVEVDALVGELGRGRAPHDALESTRARRRALGQLLQATRHATGVALVAHLARATDRSRRLIEALHVPSDLFRRRHGIDATIAQQRQRCEPWLDAEAPETEGASANLLLIHGQLLLGIGELEASERALAAATRCPSLRGDAAWSHLALVRAARGQDQLALDAAARATAASPDRPRSHAFRAVVHAIVGSRAGDLLRAAALVHEAVSSVRTSCELSARDPLENIEARLTRGRLMCLLPSAFGLRSRGMEDLREVLTAADNFKLLRAGGGRDLVRINALYYLAVALEDAGDPVAAAPLLREVITLDPVSRLGRWAYRRVSG